MEENRIPDEKLEDNKKLMEIVEDKKEEIKQKAQEVAEAELLPTIGDFLNRKKRVTFMVKSRSVEIKRKKRRKAQRASRKINRKKK